MSEQVKCALSWIKGLLERQSIEYQVVGGLAAFIHGGTRDVADIDLYIPKEKVNRILPLVSTFISKPLTHYVEHGWDLEYFQLIYRGQKIEIGLSPGTKIFQPSSNSWQELAICYERSVAGDYYGINVPTMPVAELVSYKHMLAREVDLIDIAQLSGECVSN